MLLLSVVVFGAFVYLKRLAGPVKEKKIKNLNEQAHILHVATYIGHSKKTTQWDITPRKISNKIRISCHYAYLHDMFLYDMFFANTYYVLNNFLFSSFGEEALTKTGQMDEHDRSN